MQCLVEAACTCLCHGVYHLIFTNRYWWHEHTIYLSIIPTVYQFFIALGMELRQEYPSQPTRKPDLYTKLLDVSNARVAMLKNHINNNQIQQGFSHDDQWFGPSTAAYFSHRALKWTIDMLSSAEWVVDNIPACAWFFTSTLLTSILNWRYRSHHVRNNIHPSLIKSISYTGLNLSH